MPRKAITDNASGYEFLQIGQKVCSQNSFVLLSNIYIKFMHCYRFHNLKFLRKCSFHITILGLLNRPKVHQELSLLCHRMHCSFVLGLTSFKTPH